MLHPVDENSKRPRFSSVYWPRSLRELDSLRVLVVEGSVDLGHLWPCSKGCCSLDSGTFAKLLKFLKDAAFGISKSDIQQMKALLRGGRVPGIFLMW